MQNENNKIKETNDIPKRLISVTEPFKFSNKLQNKTKKNFEIVISRYDENIDWCRNYKDFVTIYNKGANNLQYPCIQLENKGHLADTILKHIINNYDNLADATFFTHGSFNYRNDQLIKERDYSNNSNFCHKYFDEFICCDKNTLVFIPRNGENPESKYYDYPRSLGDVYRDIFDEEYTKYYKWTVGKWISVSKEKIRNSPKEIYQKMLDFVLQDWEGKEPSQHIYRTRGIYIERIIIRAFSSSNKIFITKTDIANFENWKKQIPNLFKFEGEYPEQVLAYKFLKPQMKILELGANIGRNTQIIANIVKQGKLLAVEMNKSNKDILDKIADLNKNTSVFIGAISEKPLYFDGKSWRTSKNGKVKINTKSISEVKKEYFEWNVIVADCEGCITQLCNNPEFVENTEMIIIENDFRCRENRLEFENKMYKYNFQEIFSLNKGDSICPGVPPQSWQDGDTTQKAFISVWEKKSM